MASLQFLQFILPCLVNTIFYQRLLGCCENRIISISGMLLQGLLKLLWTVYSEGELWFCLKLKIFKTLVWCQDSLKMSWRKVVFFSHSKLCTTVQWCRNRGGQGGHWPPQYLVDLLTLFQPGEGRLSPPITTGPPKVFHLPAPLLLLSWTTLSNLILKIGGTRAKLAPIIQFRAVVRGGA